VVAGVLLAAPTAGAQTPPGVESAVVEGESGSEGCSAVQSSLSEAMAEAVCLGTVKCKWTKSTSTYKSLLGFVLYKYWQRQSFCYNGTKITKLYNYSRGKSDVDPLWDWVGHTGLVRTGGVGTGGASVRTDGHFKYCQNIPFAPPCYHRYPWVITRMDNSGAVIFGGHN
jgi:hypothetical protein